ncbi:MAG: lysine--tRNA ligase, partial [Pseudomonadota bacterium]|nr:lysine--tRNA ligase [Pseudomonadota bacterium]
KISKSKGNGLSVEEWLRYGSPESLALFMYGQPKRAKRLYFDSIPKAVDEYFSHQQKLNEQEDALKLENPAFHISLKSTTDAQDMPVSFSLLLNLAGVCSADTTDELWGYISAYAKGADKQSHPHLEALARYAVAYYQDRVRPHKTYRRATEAEKQRITELRDNLAALGDDASAEEVQSAVFAAGRDHYEQLRDWFSCLYQTMLGQDQGPRMGSFFRLYGLKPSIALCDDVLTDRLV